MKADIHPKLYPEAKVICACGNMFTVGATFPQLSVEVCSKCHPFYTGQMKYVDTAGQVEKFKNRQAGVSLKKVSKTEKRRLKKLKQIEEEKKRPETLAELRQEVKGKK